MTASVTSAGAASGIDFESIISASVEAKKASLSSNISSRKAETNLQITGVGLMKSNLSTFKDLLDDMTKKNAFNKRTITTNQSSTDPAFTVSAKDDASNGNYNVTVTQLAQSTSFSQSFEGASQKFGAGSLTFSIGSGDDAKSFSIDVGEDDTLSSIRDKINNSSDSFGVTANILTLKDGTAKLVLDSGNTGDKYSNFSITASGDEKLNVFNASVSTDADGNVTASDDSSMKLVRSGHDAVIDVDGDTLTSDTNVFDGTIAGIKLTVNKLSDTETITDSDGKTSTGYKSNTLSVSTDKSAIKSMVSNFVETYNSLRTNLDNLSKSNTYTDGVSNDDGGYLAGDSTSRNIKSMLSNTLSSFTTTGDSSGLSIFSLGIKMDNSGNLSIDSTKFDEALDKNYEQVVNAFSSDDGICKKMSDSLELYTKSGGILDMRKDALNATVRNYENRENANATFLEKYEESLRNKYGNLDSLIGNLNTSLSYLNSAISSSKSSKS